MTRTLTESPGGVVTGRKVRRWGGHGWNQEPESLISDLELHGEDENIFRFGVIEVAGKFLVHPMLKKDRVDAFHSTDVHHHSVVTVYQPIHPSMTFEDIHGATYCRDDGTYWTDFSKESPSQRHEAEAYAQAKLIAHFQPRINKQGALVHAASDITERTLRHNVLLALNSFVDAATDEIADSIRKFPLGHFAREKPHADNHRALVVAACRAVLADWQAKSVTDTAVKHNLDRVKTAIDALVASLTQAPKILSRVEDIEASKPKVAEQIAAVTMVANGAPTGIDLRSKFTARDPLTFTAVSSDTDVATAVANGAMLVVSPGDAGSATITVRATAPDQRHVTQTFSVTVVAQ